MNDKENFREPMYRIIRTVYTDLLDRGMSQVDTDTKMTVNNITDAYTITMNDETIYLFDKYELTYHEYVYLLLMNNQRYNIRGIFINKFLPSCTTELDIRTSDNGCQYNFSTITSDNKRKNYGPIIQRDIDVNTPHYDLVRQLIHPDTKINKFSLSSNFLSYCNSIVSKVISCDRYFTLMINLIWPIQSSGHKNFLIFEKDEDTKTISILHYEPYGSSVNIKYRIAELFSVGMDEHGYELEIITDTHNGLQSYADHDLGFCEWYNEFILYHIFSIIYKHNSSHFGTKLPNISIKYWFEFITDFYIKNYSKKETRDIIVNFTWWGITNNLNEHFTYEFKEEFMEYFRRSVGEFERTNSTRMIISKEMFDELQNKNVTDVRKQQIRNNAIEVESAEFIEEYNNMSYYQRLLYSINLSTYKRIDSKCDKHTDCFSKCCINSKCMNNNNCKENLDEIRESRYKRHREMRRDPLGYPIP